MSQNKDNHTSDQLVDIRHHIVFTGSRGQFPDCLIRLIEFEISDSAVVRCDGFPAAGAYLSGIPAVGKLLVVHESLWDEIDKYSLLDLQSKGCMVAIAYREPERAIRILQSGDPRIKGIGFLPTELNVDSILNIIRLMLTGYAFVANDLMAQARTLPTLAPAQATGQSDVLPESEPARENGISRLRKLTRREREVLALVAEGFQNKQIANELLLSEHTVKLHLHHVISKLGARNRTDAAMQFRRELRL